MLNQIYNKSRVSTFSGLSLLLMMVLVLTVSGGASVAAAAPVEPLTTLEEVVLPPPPAQEGDDEAAMLEIQASNSEVAEDLRVLFEEMTFVQLLWEQYGYARTACAGNGLNNIQPLTEGPMVLIPNAGDLSIDGSNVAIKLNPDGEITFIPRVQGQMIGLVTNVRDNGVEIKEVPSLTLAEAEQLIATGRLVWTAQDHGPYGNGHGLPGHIASCDPLYEEQKFDEYQKSDES